MKAETSIFTKEEKQQMDNIKDQDIDYSDIAELDNYFWKNAVLVKPDKKKAISIKLDDEIIIFFKQFGKGYQTKINAILSDFVKTYNRKNHKKV